MPNLVEKEKRNLGSWILASVSLLLSIIIVFIMLLQTQRDQLVFLDMKKVIAVPVALAAKKLSKPEQASFVQHYTKALPDTIAAYGQAHHVTIVAASVLSANHKQDITNAIIQANLQTLGDAHA
jgi:hypothetical protein